MTYRLHIDYTYSQREQNTERTVTTMKKVSKMYGESTSTEKNTCI